MKIKSAELKEMIAKIVKETLAEAKLKEATDPETGLDVNGVMDKIKASKDPKEMAYYISIFQKLMQAHL